MLKVYAWHLRIPYAATASADKHHSVFTAPWAGVAKEKRYVCCAVQPFNLFWHD